MKSNIYFGRELSTHSASNCIVEGVGLNIECADSANMCMMLSFPHRNGVVRHESVMKLRNKLEELGKMKGVNQDEKGLEIVYMYNHVYTCTAN